MIATHARFDTSAIKAAHPWLPYLAAHGFDPKRAADGRYVMLCPFHAEKTPSFTIREGQETAHCYGGGCGWHGDVIKFDAQIHGDSFRDACARLGGRPTGEDWRPSPEYRRRQMAREEENRRKQSLAAQAAAAREPIITGHPWHFSETWSRSPVPLAPLAEQSRQFLAAMFSSDDVVWIGEFRDTGRPEHRSHFRPVSEWLKMDRLPGTRIAAGTFEAGEYRRRNERANRAPFVVIEADEAIGRKPATYGEVNANRLANLALHRWLKDECGWDLRAIIDTGNKSLHAWFRHPGRDELEAFSQFAPSLGIDPLFNNPAQPVRLPNVRHEKGGRLSQLVWLES